MSDHEWQQVADASAGHTGYHDVPTEPETVVALHDVAQEGERLLLEHERLDRGKEAIMATCRYCGHPIRWERTVNGAAMPLDLLSTSDGNVTFVPTEDGPRVRVLTKEEPRNGLVLFTPHFVTCTRWPRPRPGRRTTQDHA